MSDIKPMEIPFYLIFALVALEIASGIPDLMETGNPELEAEIDRKEQTISDLRGRINTLESRNENISQKYERLVEENVTKKDVEEIERELNQTSSEIKILNQKFETINQQFISSYQKTVNKYQIWMSVSLLSISFLAFDLLSGAVFGRSFTDRISAGLRSGGQSLREKISELREDESEEE